MRLVTFVLAALMFCGNLNAQDLPPAVDVPIVSRMTAVEKELADQRAKLFVMESKLNTLLAKNVQPAPPVVPARVVPAPTNFTQVAADLSITPATIVPTVAEASTFNQEAVRYEELTYTLVQPGIRGITSSGCTAAGCPTVSYSQPARYTIFGRKK